MIHWHDTNAMGMVVYLFVSWLNVAAILAGMLGFILLLVWAGSLASAWTRVSKNGRHL